MAVFMVTMSCDDDLLDKTPVTGLSSDSYNSEANFDAATMAIYDVLQWQNIGGQHVFPLLFQDIRADNMHSQFANFWAAGTVMDDFTLMNASNFNVQLLWQKWYTGVNRANIVIKRAPEFDGFTSGNMQKQLVAEAKTLRAFFYLEMHKMWNTVPLVLDPIESANDLPPLGRATREELFAQIDKDLTEAIPDLPTRSQSVLGRVTSGLAQTLLAKSKLYQRDWDGAARYSELVINSGEYALEPVFYDNWLEDESNENGIESVFEIQYGDGFTPQYFEAAGTSAQGSGSWQMMFTWVSGNYTSFSNMLPNADLKSAFYDKVNDQRFDATFLTVGSDINEISPLLATNWGLNDCCGGILDADRMSWLRPDIEDCNYAKKYFLSWELVDQLLEKSNSPKNEKIIRYAEVLLMHAEARAMGGAGSIDGQVSMDLITDRAGIDPIDATDMEAIKLQRRLELATEGWNRMSDLVRWGDAATNAKLLSKNFTANRDEYLPIPNAEREAVGFDILDQNPGY
ncbi:RagB/SusD family nutrient uptake outer membrane protein [Fulvivirgaceae bacterium BMA12]|uniref:RagB/SusD family nutrient uptake outer membrane protein n=1 Tax=Agaribacillus aureus TaxID=3051825 RepID=A0ABT8LH29_9BACT|nr:RagB/SusD family nutrient uptake outer membrane protein [Fulvivirgaceae bacterium BMA12]